MALKGVGPLLFLKVALFSIVAPGMVGGYVPWLVAGGRRAPPLPTDAASLPAHVLLLAGLAIYLRCAWEFAAKGGGTPAPIDPPKRLIVTGLYRYTRNPMYNGVVLAILAQAWLFRSGAVLAYAAVVVLAFSLFVLVYEEPYLGSRFGASYRRYRAAVPRWGFRFSPYRDVDEP